MVNITPQFHADTWDLEPFKALANKFINEELDAPGALKDMTDSDLHLNRSISEFPISVCGSACITWPKGLCF